MPRPIRWLSPRTRWFLSSRALEARFFLRPDPAFNQRFGFWLAKALALHPGIRCHAIYAASNHTHGVVTDTDGSLSAFMGYFLGMLARDVNELRDRLGPVFHRRFSAEPILDRDAVAERIAYLVCNPIEDRLVENWEEWPGVLLWTQSSRPENHPFRRLNQVAYEAAKARAEREKKTVKQEDYFEEETVTIVPVGDDEGALLDPKQIRDAVERRARMLREKHAGKLFLGRKKILAQHVEAQPKHSDRSPRPLCHTSSLELWKAFRQGWRRLVDAYREIAARFRDGDLEVRFPAYTFPPWRPLTLPLLR